MPFHRVLPGASLRDIDDAVKTGGDIIELPEDLVSGHAGKVDPKPLSDDEVAEHQQAQADKAAEVDPE